MSYIWYTSPLYTYYTAVFEIMPNMCQIPIADMVLDLVFLKVKGQLKI